MRRACGGTLARLFGVLCALALLTGRCTAGEEAPPAAQRSLQCKRELRCSTGGAGFGDQLEHYVFCEVVSFLLNATLVLSPDSFARGSKRHCCVDEYPAVAKLLGVVGEALPTTQGGAPPSPEPRNTRQVSFAEARDLHAAWQNGTTALPCDVAFVTTISSCPDTPANNWCSFLPSYDAFSVVRPRLQARGARAPQLCAERHLAMHTPGEVDVPVVVMHVRTGDVCLHCEDSGIYFRRLLERLLAASPTLTQGHRLVVSSQFPLPFSADGPFANATFAVNQTLASSACAVLTADVVIASGSSLPAFIAAFAPSWAPIILEERRKETQPRVAPKRADLFPPIPPHYFSSEDAILLDDGVPSLDNATLTTRIENALEHLRRSRNASNNTVPAAPGITTPSLILPPPIPPNPRWQVLGSNCLVSSLFNTTVPKAVLLASSLFPIRITENGELLHLLDFVTRPILTNGALDEHLKLNVQIWFPELPPADKTSFLFEISELCFANVSGYFCNSFPNPIKEPTYWSREVLENCATKDVSLVFKSSPLNSTFNISTGYWLKYDVLGPSDASAMLGTSFLNFQHRWVTTASDSRDSWLFGEELIELLNYNRVALIGDSIMMGTFADIIRFMEWDRVPHDDFFPISDKDVHKCFFMERRSGFWQWKNLSFLGLHDPNHNGLRNLKTNYYTELQNVLRVNDVVVINSGLHDLAYMRDRNVTQELEAYNLELLWLVNEAVSINRTRNGRLRVIWKATTHTLDYEHGREDAQFKHDLPGDVISLNAIARQVADIAGWDYFDSWTPTYASSVQWWSDRGHFHYPSGQYKGGMSRVLSQMLLRLILR